ncbi:DNA methyltransferase [Rhodovibrio sodomensis]|uniref:DNA methyltransferase n=1 Tax=Rhodovibrio sodomensis TaxID=1088 RepID=UPI0019038C36|nr:DNA methyltransferase [Rhodovibrio sodomensis]
MPKFEHARSSGQTSPTKPTIRIENTPCQQLLQSLEDKTIDLVLTDPPYVISRETGFSSVVDGESRFAMSMDFGAWDHEFTVGDLDTSVKAFYRVLRQGGVCIIWFDLWKLSILRDIMANAGFKQIRFIEWVKTNPVPINSSRNYLTNSREIAVLGVKGSNSTFNATYHNGIFRHPISHCLQSVLARC